MRLIVKTTFAVITLYLFCNSCSKREKTTEAPNVILITADDLGLQLSCYGDSTISTPNIDAMAEAGIRFTNAYVTQASCSPSRSSIFTGLHPHENGQLGLAHQGEFAMLPDVVTLPQMFKDAGYSTGVIGKVHVLPEESFPFDYNTNEIGFRLHFTRNMERVRDTVDAFITRTGNKPFFLMVNYFDPHRPYREQQINGLPEKPLKGDDVEAFGFLGVSSEKIRKDVAGYYNCVKRIDTGVGLIMDLLESRDLLENTLVIFLGDHGPPVIRAKVSTFEAGLKIPMIITWKGRIPEGIIRDDFVSTIDLFATIASAIQYKGEPQGEGYSLLPEDMATLEQPREYLFAGYNAHQSYSFIPQRTARYKNYKMILTLLENRMHISNNQTPEWLEVYLEDEDYGNMEKHPWYGHLFYPPPVQLFNLEKDPNELINLAGDPVYAEIESQMFEAILQWRERTNDPFLNSEILLDMVHEADSLRALGELRVHGEGYQYMINH